MSSAGELAVARSVSFPARRILLHGNAKTPADLHAAVSYGVGRIVLDSAAEIVRVAMAARRRQRVLIRVTPGVDAHAHAAVATGIEDQKVGFSLSSGAAADAVRRVLAHPELELAGLHCHLGSQITRPEPYETARPGGRAEPGRDAARGTAPHGCSSAARRSRTCCDGTSGGDGAAGRDARRPAPPGTAARRGRGHPHAHAHSRRAAAQEENSMDAEREGRAFLVPVSATPSGTLALRTGRLATGERIGLAFTCEQSLREVLGPWQQWTHLSERALHAMLAPVGVARVRIDPYPAAGAAAGPPRDPADPPRGSGPE